MTYISIVVMQPQTGCDLTLAQPKHINTADQNRPTLPISVLLIEDIQDPLHPGPSNFRDVLSHLHRLFCTLLSKFIFKT